jgi:hypothetical protein
MQFFENTGEAYFTSAFCSMLSVRFASSKFVFNFLRYVLAMQSSLSVPTSLAVLFTAFDQVLFVDVCIY